MCLCLYYYLFFNGNTICFSCLLTLFTSPAHLFLLFLSPHKETAVGYSTPQCLTLRRCCPSSDLNAGTQTSGQTGFGSEPRRVD